MSGRCLRALRVCFALVQQLVGNLQGAVRRGAGRAAQKAAIVYQCRVPSAKEKAMSSGVQCTDECVTKFNELKLKVPHLILLNMHALFLKLTLSSLAHLPFPHLQDQ